MPGTRPSRRRHRAAVSLVGTAAMLAAAYAAAPGASAAVPDTVNCKTTGAIYAVAGTSPYSLLRYPISAPGDAKGPPFAIGASAVVGSSGWNNFGRVLVGPDNRIYGVKTTGIYAYRHTGGASWSPNGVLIPSSNGILGATNRDKMSVDSANNLWVIDSANALRVYRHDLATNTWVLRARPMAGDMTKYDYLVAGDNGVLYARTTTGFLYRMRYDVASQRLITVPQYIATNGSNWDTYKQLFSTGGDIIYGVTLAGALHRYIYNEKTNLMSAYTVVGSGWNFPNVGALTDSCLLKSSTAVSTPTLGIANWTPIQVQANGNGVDYAYTTNNGELKYRHQSDENFDQTGATWETVSGQMTGAPTLAVQPNSRAKVVGLATGTGNLSEFTQALATGSTLSTAVDIGGTMAGGLASSTLLDGRQAVVAVASNGTLWGRLQLKANTDGMSAWRQLGAAASYAGDIAIAALDNGDAAIAARTTSGQLVTATITPNGNLGTLVLGAVTTLPSVAAPFTGRPSITVYNGSRIRVTAGSTASATDPTVVSTILQPSAGAPFGSWATVGETGYDLEGAPAAMKAPSSGRMSILARTSTGELRQSLETVEGSNEFTAWQPLPTSDPGQPVTQLAGTDLTTFTYGTGQTRWGFAFRAPTGEPIAITAGGSGALRAQAPAFATHQLGKRTEH